MPLPPTIKDLIPALNLIPHPEGGFFVETYRSGTKPMSTQGQTGYDDPNLVSSTDQRENNRPDNDIRRNALTSIFWVPTIQSPHLILGVNYSDHVHYYHGGRPFQYILYDPKGKGELRKVILGPDLHKGHQLQVCVPGGIWKCGSVLGYNGDDEEEAIEYKDYEYSLIGEAVAPGM